MNLGNSTYKVIFLLVAVLQMQLSCKSKTNAIHSEVVDTKLKVEDVLRLHQASFPNFRTMSANIGVSYTDEKNNQNIPLTFRMEKDKVIWLSAPLGMAKIMITPEKVTFYNRLDNTYFDGNFDYIRNLLGFEVNFQNLQNLLLGQTIYPIKNGKIKAEKKYYLIEDQELKTTQISYHIIPKIFRLGQFQVTDKINNFNAIASITYQINEEKLMPNTIHINSTDNNGTVTIDLDFKNLKFNTDLNFPFKIPSGAKRIEVK